MRSIAEAVQRHARQQPGQVALVFEGRTINYAELAAQAEQFARALASTGVLPGDRVALFLGNCPEFVTAYLGTHLAGGIVVLVNAQYREVELRHIMTDAGVRLCVTGAAGAEEVEQLALPDLTTLVIVDADASALPSPPRRRRAGGEDAPHPRQLAYAEFVAGDDPDAPLPALPEPEAP
ncbi:MAG TPA: AMP-binding protein, partial [Ktedonobacterales bacterium]|nr:AMP-binding protein [Ktedonobacterales bacterium]